MFDFKKTHLLLWWGRNHPTKLAFNRVYRAVIAKICSISRFLWLVVKGI